jgi:hypothetical protein
MIGSGVVASDDHPSLFRILDDPRKSASQWFESTRVVAFGTERPLVFSEFPEQGISFFGSRGICSSATLSFDRLP